ncbi:hypothetical protein [Microbacterium aurum]
MSTRTRPMALDGRSVDADLEQTPERVSQVQLAILGRLADCGPMTDDALIAAYAAAAAAHPEIPTASPQSIRTRRAELCRRGVVCATTIPGTSAYGRPATVWALTAAAKEPQCLFT